MTRRRTHVCEVCGRRVTSGARGRVRTQHRECKPLADALNRLEKHLQQLPDMTPGALADLRYRILLASTAVPRARYPKGHPKAGQFVPVHR